jgi:hypothetical protein
MKCLLASEQLPDRMKASGAFPLTCNNFLHVLKARHVPFIGRGEEYP